MQRNYAVGTSCCFTGKPPAIDPLSAGKVVAAGEACESGSCGCASGGGCALATIYFPDQTYKAGFCPSEALEKGTLFPELVSAYPTGCGCAE